MPLPALAEPADLLARGIDASATALVMLEVASSLVRGAAGSPILETTSTIGLTGWWCETYLDLPGQPVTAVTAVSIDGQAVTDWRLDNGRLWRCSGWGTDHGPAAVEVTQTHGLPEVPERIVDLVCALAGAGAAASAEGYETHGGVVAERIDDYSVTWAQGAEAVSSVMELPRSTRLWLASQFGGGVGMVAHR